MYCMLHPQGLLIYILAWFLGILCVGNPDNPLTYVYVTGDLKILFGVVFLLFFLLASFALLQLWDLAFKFKFWNTLRMLSAEVEWWWRGRTWMSLPASLELLDMWLGETDRKPESPESASFFADEHESELEERLSASVCRSSWERRASRRLMARNRRMPRISRDGDGVIGDTLRLSGAASDINTMLVSGITEFMIEGDQINCGGCVYVGFYRRRHVGLRNLRRLWGGRAGARGPDDELSTYATKKCRWLGW